MRWTFVPENQEWVRGLYTIKGWLDEDGDPMFAASLFKDGQRVTLGNDTSLDGCMRACDEFATVASRHIPWGGVKK